MTKEKAPTRGGPGWKSGVDGFFSNSCVAVVKVFILLAALSRARGAR